MALRTPEQFLSDMYEASPRAERDGIVEVMSYIDESLFAGEAMGDFSVPNRILDTVDLSRLNIDMALAFFTITNCIPIDILPSRPAFVERLRQRMEPEIGVERTANIIGERR